MPTQCRCTGQSVQFERTGFDAPRQTLARWTVGCGQLVQPLINLLRDRLHDSGYIRMDETTVQVMKKSGETAQSTSYLWVQQSGEREQPVVLYDYAPTRAGEVPVALLGAFNGYLQTDDYAGYRTVVTANGITPLYCCPCPVLLHRSAESAGLEPEQPAAQALRQGPSTKESSRLDLSSLCHQAPCSRPHAGRA